MRNSRHSEDSRLYFDWLEIAASDLLAARLLTGKKQCLEIAGFHCQQCMEKAFKAYLMFTGSGLVDGHNLTWLCRQAIRRDDGFSSFMDICAGMNRLYIETRYPSDDGERLEPPEAEHFCRAAGELYDFICDRVYRHADMEAD
ncbi:MAG: HEPN domain-containing protein [Clostridiales bacterium]|nr:HEPN domain-containing protein [Clostridiales bacterium]